MHKIFFPIISVAMLVFAPIATPALYGLETATYPTQPTSTITTDTTGKPCNPNTPSYSQPGCVEQGAQIPSYTPPTTLTPYEIPKEGPAWNSPSEGASEDTIETNESEKELTSAELLDMIKSLLKEVEKLPALVDKEVQTLTFFSINKKNLKAEISEYVTNLNNVEKKLQNGEVLTDEQLSEELGEFDHEYFQEVLSRIHDTYTIVRTVPIKDIRMLLVKHFKPIATTIESGDYAGANEMLEPYVAELTKNKSLYLTKKFSKSVKQKIQKKLKALGKKINAIQKELESGVENEEKPESEKLEKKELKESGVKKPLVDTKRISEDTKKINEAVQRSIQNNAQNRVWNLYQKSIFGY